ncbi:MAG TPA: ParA family protein [Vicinamibacteria bacterium]|nr:ParA family protein [Vicinamibacteria bacterium]
MARRLAIASQKGGVGKTTVALNLAVALAEKGRRTLLADLDPQGGIALSLAKGDTELPGLAELLINEGDPLQAVTATQLPGLRLLARGRLDPTDVASFEAELSNGGALDRALARTEGDADLVILDTPSGLGRVTTAALGASDFALLAFQTESLALRSIGQALRVIEHVQATENPRLRLLGILPTLVERDHPSSLAVLGEIWNGFPDALETMVPRAEAFARASEMGVPVSFLSGAPIPEARRFDLLADEIEARMDRIRGMERADEAKPARQLL